MSKQILYPWWLSDYNVYIKAMGPLYAWSTDAWTCIWYDYYYQFYWWDFCDCMIPAMTEARAKLLCKELVAQPHIARDICLAFVAHFHPCVLGWWPPPRWNLNLSILREHVPPAYIWQPPLQGDPPRPIADWQTQTEGFSPSWPTPEPPPPR